MAMDWDRIAKITGHVFDVESESFLLRNLMEAPLLANEEDIEVSWGRNKPDAFGLAVFIST